MTSDEVVRFKQTRYFDIRMKDVAVYWILAKVLPRHPAKFDYHIVNTKLTPFEKTKKIMEI